MRRKDVSFLALAASPVKVTNLQLILLISRLEETCYSDFMPGALFLIVGWSGLRVTGPRVKVHRLDLVVSLG